MKREQPDYNMTLAIADGTAGRAYNQRRTITADLNRVTLEDLHLSPEEAAQIWPKVRSLLSIPMVDEDGKTAGVVTFDSTLPMQETGFNHLAIQTYLETCAALLADWF
jgi:putative methionine-R-sulfoxide reductase with GAF domain